MKLAILFSGGKDSTYTVYKALKEKHEIKYLITVIPKNKDSYMFHTACLNLPKIQAKLIGIEYLEIEVSGQKEKEVEELKQFLEKIKNEIDAIGAGAIKSKYQRERIEKIAKELNLKTFFPLLNKNCYEHWKEILNLGFKVIITKISTYGIPEKFLGKVIDNEALEELKVLSEKYGFDLCFEGGEAETLVLDSPIFSKEIVLKNFEIKKESNSFWIEIKEIELKDKK
ncbi:MAG: diphthine--ammonia ligase [Candidatus Aenigmatarchaeota archaeon]